MKLLESALATQNENHKKEKLTTLIQFQQYKFQYRRSHLYNEAKLDPYQSYLRYDVIFVYPIILFQEGRTMADRDGGSSYVVSPGQQLYTLQV